MKKKAEQESSETEYRKRKKKRRKKKKKKKRLETVGEFHRTHERPVKPVMHTNELLLKERQPLGWNVPLESLKH